MAWKYVMMDVRFPKTGLHVLFPVIFPDKLVHSYVASAMSTVLAAHGMPSVSVASAGKIEEVTVDGLGGGSETLAKVAMDVDTDVINNYEYKHGIL
jgi:hypothetical protein